MTLSPISINRPAVSRYTTQPNRPQVLFASSGNTQPEYGSERPQFSPAYRAFQAVAAGTLLLIGALVHERVANDGQTFFGMPQDLRMLEKADAPLDPISVLHFKGFMEPRLNGEITDAKLMHNADNTKIYHFKLAGMGDTQFVFTTTPLGTGLEAQKKGGQTDTWAIFKDEGSPYYEFESRDRNTGKDQQHENSKKPTDVKFFLNTFEILEGRLQKIAVDHSGKVSLKEAPVAPSKAEAPASDATEPQPADAKPAEQKPRKQKIQVPRFRFPEERTRTVYV